MTVPPVELLRSHVGNHEFDDAEAFLEALRPRGELWRPDPRDWIFRGHADVDWPLLPSAHRGEPWKDFRIETTIPFLANEATEGTRLAREIQMVRSFYDEANASGLALPIVPTDDDWQQAIYNDWPSQKLFPLVALAQHHRLPTRLLDWTRRGLIAAYFAAQLPRGGSSAARLCVWALNRRSCEQRPINSLSPYNVRVQAAPHASNPNLHAQSGLFTFSNYERTSQGNDLLTTDVIVSELAQRARASTLGRVHIMRRLTLPVRCARDLLVELDREDISSRTLFPNFDGVVEYLRFQKPCQ